MWACTMLGRFVQDGVASGFIYLLSSSALRGVSSLTWPRGVSRGLFSQSSTPDSAELRAGRSNAIAPTAAARSTQRSSNLRFSLTTCHFRRVAATLIACVGSTRVFDKHPATGVELAKLPQL